VRWFTSVVLLSLVAAVAAAAEHNFAEITAVDVEKRTVTYTIVGGKMRGAEVTAPLAKDCVLKEGDYRLGKPATTKEGEDIADGLANPVFKKASDKNPLRVNVYTAEEDDADKKVKRGDVLKILVNPPPKKKG
jgi:hypothetical protein